MIDGKSIHEFMIQIGEEQNLGALACVAVSENIADSQFISNRAHPFRLVALRMLAITLRELAGHVDEAISELEDEGAPEAPGTAN